MKERARQWEEAAIREIERQGVLKPEQVGEVDNPSQSGVWEARPPWSMARGVGEGLREDIRSQGMDEDETHSRDYVCLRACRRVLPCALCEVWGWCLSMSDVDPNENFISVLADWSSSWSTRSWQQFWCLIKHMVFSVSQICYFSLFYETVNWIFLFFGLLVRKYKQLKDVFLESGNLWQTFLST